MSTTTTTNYGWTIPNDDELVKNGAAAIRTLGQAIDTTAAASFAPGLVHVNTTQITGTPASVSLDDIFTTDYQHYLVIMHYIASTTIGLRARLRDAGSDITTASSYTTQTMQVQTSTLSGTIVTNDYFNLSIGTSTTSTLNLLITNPFLATQTGINFQGGTTDGTRLGTGRQSTASSVDGLTIFPNTGTFSSGSISVFGYRTA